MKYRFANSDSLSPLRYPGGKAALAPYIGGVIEENFLTGCTFYEPFAGGASASLELLRLGFISDAVLVERDPLVYAFWWAVLNCPEDLCAEVTNCEISIETWQNFQPLREVTDVCNTTASLLTLGLAGLFFNRTNFSGIIGAGPIGGRKQSSKYKIDCRFNKLKLNKQIMALSQFKDRIRVYPDDAMNFLKKNAEEIATGFSFVYIDPPYYKEGPKLYRHHFSDENHRLLAEFTKIQGYPWLMSYDDHPRIRELYASEAVQPIYLDYKVKSNRRAQELVISNLMIPPPVYEPENLYADQGQQELLQLELAKEA